MGKVVGLKSKRCVPCEGGASPLSEAEAELLRRQVPGWRRTEAADGVPAIRHDWKVRTHQMADRWSVLTATWVACHSHSAADPPVHNLLSSVLQPSAIHHFCRARAVMTPASPTTQCHWSHAGEEFHSRAGALQEDSGRRGGGETPSGSPPGGLEQRLRRAEHALSGCAPARPCPLLDQESWPGLVAGSIPRRVTQRVKVWVIKEQLIHHWYIHSCQVKAIG